MKRIRKAPYVYPKATARKYRAATRKRIRDPKWCAAHAAGLHLRHDKWFIAIALFNFVRKEKRG